MEKEVIIIDTCKVFNMHTAMIKIFLEHVNEK